MSVLVVNINSRVHLNPVCDGSGGGGGESKAEQYSNTESGLSISLCTVCSLKIAILLAKYVLQDLSDIQWRGFRDGLGKIGAAMAAFAAISRVVSYIS